ncbi:MAG: hypothetical protein ACK6BG_00060 [Cyanobacteriota bacterium]
MAPRRWIQGHPGRAHGAGRDANGNSGNPSLSVEDGGGGIGNRNSGATGSVQLGYQQEQRGLAAIWTQVQPESQFVPGTTPFMHEAIDHKLHATTNA